MHIDGTIELMHHRRIFTDDGLGLGHTLDDVDPVTARGIVMTSDYYLVVQKLPWSDLTPGPHNRPADKSIPLRNKIKDRPFFTYLLGGGLFEKTASDQGWSPLQNSTKLHRGAGPPRFKNPIVELPNFIKTELVKENVRF